MRTIHARAPLRISFAGGGTDVPPYPELVGGAVLSATIDWYAYATVAASDVEGVHIHSLDVDTAMALSGRKELAQVVLDDTAVHSGAEVTISCDAPPGSGLGSSSSLIVAAAAALDEFAGTPSSPYDLAERAVRLEREGLGVPGGLQDQYAAVFGGFNFIEFHAEGVLVNPLRLRRDVLAEFHGSLVLVPTPNVGRRSSGILARQIDQTTRRADDTMARLDRIKVLAVEMKTALLRGDVAAIGDVLHESWMAKRGLTAGITTDGIDSLYDHARALGAVGGKLLGAGGGGYILLMVPFERRGALVGSLRAGGIQPVGFSFTKHGVQAWRSLG